LTTAFRDGSNQAAKARRTPKAAGVFWTTRRVRKKEKEKHKKKNMKKLTLEKSLMLGEENCRGLGKRNEKKVIPTPYFRSTLQVGVRPTERLPGSKSKEKNIIGRADRRGTRKS